MMLVDVAAAQTECRRDIIFVLDESGSVGSANFDLMKSFVSQLVGGFEIENNNTRVGVVTYSSSVGESFQLNSYSTVDDVQNAISSLTYSGGSTRTDEALEYVRTTMLTTSNGDRSDVPNVVVVFTDGKSTNGGDTKVSIQVYQV